MSSVFKSIWDLGTYEWRATVTITGLLAAGNIIGLTLIFGYSFIIKMI